MLNVTRAFADAWCFRARRSSMHLVKKLRKQTRQVERWRAITYDHQPGSRKDVGTSFSLPSPFDPTRPGLLDLPLELQADIFSQVAQVDHNAPIILSQLNSQLRTAALSTPRLWSTIDVNHSPQRIQAHLNRAAGVSLDVLASVFSIMDSEDVSLAQLGLFTHLLLPHLPQIRSIHATLYRKSWAAFIFNFIQTHEAQLIELRQLELGISNLSLDREVEIDSDDEGNTVPVSIISSSATIWRMEKLCLTKLRVIDTNMLPEFPTRSFQFRHNEWMLKGNLIRILSKMPALEYLELIEGKFREPIPELGEEADPQPFLLNQLKAINLVGLRFELCEDLLDVIDGPNLESLVVRFNLAPSVWNDHLNEWNEQDSDTDSNFDDNFINNDEVAIPLEDWWPKAIVKFSSTLQYLHLTGCWMEPYEWTTLFEGLWQLIHLRLGSCDLRGPELEALGGSGLGNIPGALCCPKLLQIELDNESFLKSSTIRTMLSTRMDLVRIAGGLVSKVNSVALRGWDEVNIELEDVQAIREMVDVFTLGVLGLVHIVEPQLMLLSDDEDYSESSSIGESSIDGSEEDGEWTPGDETDDHSAISADSD